MSSGPGAVYLFGATGLVGSELLELLLAETEWRVVSWGRRATGVRHPRLEERIGDPAAWSAPRPPGGGDAAEAPGEPGVRAAFCALGTTLRRAGSREAFRSVDHDLVVAAARRARQDGARHFVLVSSLGADPASRVFYNRVKGEAEESVRGIGFAALTIVRPSLLLGSRGESRPAESTGKLLGTIASPFMLGPLRRWRPVHARVVALAMLRAAASDDRGVRVLESDEAARLGAARAAG